MRAWWTGAVLVAVGAAWLIADRVMTTLFPLSWGGPDIGAGLLLVLALGVAVAGALTLAAAGARLLARREVFAELGAPRPVRAPTRVALLTPPPGWTGAPTSLPLGSQDFLIASAQGRQSELRQVEFSASDLAALDPRTVQYSDDDGTSRDLVHRRAARSAFHDLARAR